MLLLIFCSNAAKVKIDPRIGPIHGVHPNPKAAPTKNGKYKLLLYLSVKILKSLFKNLRSITLRRSKEKIIIIIPAKILKVFELIKKSFPKYEAVDPRTINTKEKPKVKKIVFKKTRLLFFLANSSSDVPEI